MTTFDVRTDTHTVTQLRVADHNSRCFIAEYIVQTGGGGITIKDRSGGSRELEVKDREHAQNLIKGLNKAIDLGWV